MDTTEPHKIILALGSNSSRENLQSAAGMMKADLTIVRASEIVETEPEDIDGECRTRMVACGCGHFYNQLLLGTTDMELDMLRSRTKEIERTMGRMPDNRTEIPIDIDILEYDGHMMHRHDWERAYVRRLMAQIEEQTKHK